MNQIPALDTTERRILDAAMTDRHGLPVSLEPAEIERKRVDVDETPALCPGF